MNPKEALRVLGRKFFETSNKTSITVERPTDPHMAEIYERLACKQLTRLFIDPEILVSLASVYHSLKGLQDAEINLRQMEIELGVNLSTFPTKLSDLTPILSSVNMRSTLMREQVLSIVPAERRTVIEGRALLEAQRILVEKLKESGLNPNYRDGAEEMLRRIEFHLSKDIPPTGQNFK